jgi:phosphopantetheinyl transferase (holo-ACP synthase)
MNPKSMDMHAADWPAFTEQHLFASRAQQVLQFPHPVTCVLLDLQLLAEKVDLTGVEKTLGGCLSSTEMNLLKRFTYAKRKREWLGGRLAAKYAAARLIDRVQPGQHTLRWEDFSILADENGRPAITAADTTGYPIPDISISHSGTFASALAVHRGFGGLDLQENTPRVMRVKNRFCNAGEERILQNSSPATPQDFSIPLTKLWAAKEALRKVARIQTLPGFLEMELVEISYDEHDKTLPWNFIFRIKPSAGFFRKSLNVAVTSLENYALAVTLVDDTLG